MGGVTNCCLGGEGNGCSTPKLALRVADMTVATVVACCTATATAATCCPKEADVCVMAAAHVVHFILGVSSPGASAIKGEGRLGSVPTSRGTVGSEYSATYPLGSPERHQVVTHSI